MQQQPDMLKSLCRTLLFHPVLLTIWVQDAQQGAEDEPMEISSGGLDPRMVQAAEAVGIDPAFLEALPAELRSEVCTSPQQLLPGHWMRAGSQVVASCGSCIQIIDAEDGGVLFEQPVQRVS